MTRPITLFTGQWADLPFEEMCRLASGWGYDGLELACWGDHFDPWAAVEDDSYVPAKLEMLKTSRQRNRFKGWALIVGFCAEAVAVALVAAAVAVVP